MVWSGLALPQGGQRGGGAAVVGLLGVGRRAVRAAAERVGCRDVPPVPVGRDQPRGGPPLGRLGRLRWQGADPRRPCRRGRGPGRRRRGSRSAGTAPAGRAASAGRSALRWRPAATRRPGDPGCAVGGWSWWCGCGSRRPAGWRSACRVDCSGAASRGSTVGTSIPAAWARRMAVTTRSKCLSSRSAVTAGVSPRTVMSRSAAARSWA